ncbi:unnamed protein product [Brugia timori]|uniref:Mut7-C RNAse domain-containing protein n=1 Tax=Brugia timori TaxID=42155 RepID=A0A0R3QN78_9BILA|nr:unnamed protein product [Brugia timori]
MPLRLFQKILEIDICENCKRIFWLGGNISTSYSLNNLVAKICWVLLRSLKNDKAVCLTDAER